MNKEYSARILRVDLEQRNTRVITVDNSILRKYIGGVGLGSRILWNETSSTTDPFSPENRLMFMIGPLTGMVPWSSRASICALSPLNNAWGEATIGGTWAAEFSKTGLLGIVISGCARQPVYLYIKDDDVTIEDASHLWGQDTFDTHDLLQKETDNKACVAAIGRAGERLVRMAGIVCDGSSSRIAARCGLGAVMGSKNLKAVVVRGTKKPEVFDQTGLKATNKEIRQLTDKLNSGALGPRSEPPDAIERQNRIGNLGVRNQSLGRWDAFAKKFRESFELGRHYYCSLCPTSCMESHVNERTRLQVLEMLMPVGSNCFIDNFTALQEAYELCNRYGIDTISFGYTLTGLNFKTEEFVQAGERIFNLKRLINLRRGLSGKDDTLPARFLTKLPDVSDEGQKLPPSFAELLQEYYTLRGWDKDGTPTQKKLGELQLP